MKHNFILSTTRPELLKKQVDSFFKILNGRDIEFYVFDDSTDKEHIFKKEIEKIMRANKNARINYFSLIDQKKILKKQSKLFFKLMKISEEDFMSCFKENGKLRGIRSIQNKSIFIFYLINKEINSILHKIDDDVLPYIATTVKKDVLEVKLYKDFFIDKEKILENETIITGSNFTIDSPSPLVQHIDFIEFLFNLTNKICLNNDDVINKKISSIPPLKPIKFIDKFNLVNPKPITKENTYLSVLKNINKYIESYNHGIQRVVINDDELQKPDNSCKNNYFPGGCVSFLYKNIPTLTPNFGNQDLLWELIESLDGKNVFSNGLIGHIRVSTNRVSILDDLKDTSYKHQTAITYSVFDYLKKQENSKSIRHFYNDFIIVMNKWLYESKYFVEESLKNISNTNLYNHKKYEKNLCEIRKFLLEIKKAYPKIIKNYKTDKNIKISKVMKNYYKRKRVFDRLMSYITKNL